MGQPTEMRAVMWCLAGCKNETEIWSEWLVAGCVKDVGVKDGDVWSCCRWVFKMVEGSAWV